MRIYVNCDWFKSVKKGTRYFIAWEDRTLPVDQRKYEIELITLKEQGE